jgi:hypothetical protein
MIFLIEALKITVVTEASDFVTHLRFNKGLNIIRADNSSGKSTCMDAILYGLGLEVLKGKRGIESLKPVLYDEVEDHGNMHKVLESFVELEISNNKSQTITLRRQIVGSVNPRVISVFEDQHIDSLYTKAEPYFIHDKGAATNAKGFHQYLTEFLGIELPRVVTTQGSKVPLYIECFFPLFFIEQRRGWTEIQATTPNFYKIQNLKKLAIEFILGLDVSKIQEKRLEVRLEKERIKSKYLSIKNNIDFLASQVHGSLMNFPSLSTKAELKPEIGIFVSESEWVTLDQMIYRYRDELSQIRSQINLEGVNDTLIANSERKIKYEHELHELTSALFFEEAQLQKIDMDLYNEKASLRLIENRISSIGKEIVRNQDVLKLKKYGADVNSQFALDHCPTCSQRVNDTLFENLEIQSPMSLSDNIDFLKGQLDAAKLIKTANENSLESFQSVFNGRSARVSKIREKIRNIKDELIRGNKVPDIERVRDLVKLEEYIKTSIDAKDKLDESLEQLSVLFIEWKGILTEDSNLPSGSLSITDQEKLKLLENYFVRNLEIFGFKSKSVDRISISTEDYKPSSDGFDLINENVEKDKDLVYQSSASDNIRIIWAYTLALLQMCSKFSINHWGLVCFDEPGQHQMAEQSLAMLFLRAKDISSNKNQIIITTSQEEEKILSVISKDKINFINFAPGEKTIYPDKN